MNDYVNDGVKGCARDKARRAWRSDAEAAGDGRIDGGGLEDVPGGLVEPLAAGTHLNGDERLAPEPGMAGRERRGNADVVGSWPPADERGRPGDVARGQEHVGRR